ncbi:MAG TPA: FAD-dependent oxidoreductase [Thermoleophilaceae bacterium]|jgi:succinate dehydrogenase/fumarate reductase flavoprotein subunit|nr:FAD-dependent oxidoreductase [Thermoleophilaceae bacterium]
MPRPDLLVAGGGVAGMAAAAHAARQGARVLVVEKCEQLGGSGALSAGILWTAPDLHTFEQVCPRGDRELGRVLVEGFDGAVELAREATVEVSERWTGQMGFGVAVRIDIHGLLDRWAADVVDAGGVIRRRTNVADLLLDGDGAVCGAALGPERVEQPAGSVLLATGGFQGDAAAVREFLGPGAEAMPVRSAPGSTGDGLRMGRAAGAALAGPMDGFYGHLVPSPLARFEPEDFLPLTQYHSRDCVLVNRDGSRFTCEKWGDEVSNQALLREPGSRGLLLCDERVRREHAVGAPYPHGQVVDRFELARAAGARITSVATLEELADLSGAGAGMLAERGLSEPPFWALEVQPTLTFTFGGLAADADGQVRDSHRRPIPGLFAAGADVGGLQDTGYVGGLILGLVFGPRAADAALKRSAFLVRS